MKYKIPKLIFAYVFIFYLVSIIVHLLAPPPQGWDEFEVYFGQLMGMALMFFILLTLVLSGTIFKIDELRKEKVSKFLLKGVVLPIVVGFVLFLITGSAGLTIVTIPIVGALGASVTLG